MKKSNPWAWIPSLYFAEGLPYVVVMTLSVIMYKRLEVSNTDIALYTSWLYFPWVIKPIWSPFVDLIRTKRWWIYAMQLLIGAGMAGVAFTLPGVPPDLSSIQKHPDKDFIRAPCYSYAFLPQQFLYFFPLPQGQGSFRPTFGAFRCTVS